MIEAARNVALLLSLALAQDTPPDPATVPFTLCRGLIVVEVHVNGQGPFRFSVDTGASGAGRIDRRVVNQLELEAGDRVTSHDGTGGQSLRDLVPVEGLVLGTHALGGAELLVGEYAWVLGAGAERIDGVLGDGLLRGTPFTIDYPGRRLLLRVPSLAGPDERTFSFRVSEGGVPVVPLKIGDDEGVGVLDTGSDGTLSMPAEFLDLLELAEEPRAAGHARTSEREFELRSGLLAEPVEVGPIRLDGVRALFSEHWGYPILGYGVLHEQRITIDDAHGWMRMETEP